MDMSSVYHKFQKIWAVLGFWCHILDPMNNARVYYRVISQKQFGEKVGRFLKYYVLATEPFLRVFLHSFCTLPPIIMVPWKMPPKGDKPVIFQAPIFHETMIMGERVGAFGVFGISILEFSSSLARPPANPLGQWRRRRDGRHIWRHQESVKM